MVRVLTHTRASYLRIAHTLDKTHSNNRISMSTYFNIRQRISIFEKRKNPRRAFNNKRKNTSYSDSYIGKYELLANRTGGR